jgi:hypothetical protein
MALSCVLCVCVCKSPEQFTLFAVCLLPVLRGLRWPSCSHPPPSLPPPSEAALP